MRRPLVPVLVFLGMVVAIVSSLGAPLVPTIAVADGVSLADAQWSLTITLLAGAVATPTMGRLGDGPRRREVVLLALLAVSVGSVLAALPVPFWVLLVGRALMGTGLGLTPLAMAAARDAMSGERSRSTVALLSVTTVAGVGLGYPLTGVIADNLSFRAAFGFGAVVALTAFAAALLVFPSTRGRVAPPLDVAGAVLIGAGLAGLLLTLSELETWSLTSLLALAVGSVGLLALWVRQELHTPHPLVDLRLVRHRPVLTADLTGLLAGVGMYVLISLVIRFVQTPTIAGYGFGGSVVVAGLVLLPFSAASVLASRTVPVLARRTTPRLVLPLGCGVFVVGELLFATSRSSLWELFVVMGLAGFGVGCTFAALPALIVAAVPPGETGSAMSFNQVLRYVGYSTGSALSATILQASTPAGQRLPADSGYTTAALFGCAVLIVAGVASALLPARATTAAVAPADGVTTDGVITDGVTTDGVPIGAR